MFAIVLSGGFWLAQAQPQAKRKQRTGSDPILQHIKLGAASASTLTNQSTGPAFETSGQKSVQPTPAMTFDALIQVRKLTRQEGRMFEAQTWEPDLREALELGPSVPLRRVSAI